MKERDEDYVSRFLTPEQLIDFDEQREEFDIQHLIYAPNSINHGWKNGGHFKTETLLRTEVGRLYDFIDFLFSDIEYCDHANESEAWDEFDQKTFADMLHSELKAQECDATTVDSKTNDDK